jgi:general stress protein 26
MSDLHNTKAKEILNKIQYATVATVTPEGKPWNSPVAHEMDEDNNIYWFSDKENQHSINIRKNPHAFIVIYDSTVPEGEGEGVYIEADVEELSGVEEINNIRNTKKGKIVDDANEFLGDAVRRCYKAIPKRMWINDAEEIDGKFIRDYRVEINL